MAESEEGRVRRLGSLFAQQRAQAVSPKSMYSYGRMGSGATAEVTTPHAVEASPLMMSIGAFSPQTSTTSTAGGYFMDRLVSAPVVLAESVRESEAEASDSAQPALVGGRRRSASNKVEYQSEGKPTLVVEGQFPKALSDNTSLCAFWDFTNKSAHLPSHSTTAPPNNIHFHPFSILTPSRRGQSEAAVAREPHGPARFRQLVLQRQQAGQKGTGRLQHPCRRSS